MVTYLVQVITEKGRHDVYSKYKQTMAHLPHTEIVPVEIYIVLKKNGGQVHVVYLICKFQHFTLLFGL